MTDREPAPSERIALIGKLLAVGLFFVMLFVPLAGMPPAAQRLAAVTMLMGVLWVTQAIPIPVTSLIPLAAFPLLGIQTADDVSNAYMNKNIFLFLGGFIIALGIEKWDLHLRIALHILHNVGTSLKLVVLGFMLATAFLSMWISNTASTLLMLPIGLAMILSLKELTGSDENDEESTRVFQHLAVVLLLGIAYSASLGGLTTLVGTPTNVTFIQIWENSYPDGPEISAGEWMVAVVPLGSLMLLCAWGVLTFRLPALPEEQKLDRGYFTEKLQELGSPTTAERRMFTVFVITGALWIFRKPLIAWELVINGVSIPLGWGPWVEQLLLKWNTPAELASKAVHDSTVAMLMAMLLFLIPARKNEQGETEYLMDWPTAERLPWGILLLIGGGFAIAGAFKDTGLSLWLGERLAEETENWPLWLVIGAVCFLMTFLTEFTSNVATVSTLLPVLTATAMHLEIDPRLIMIPATISASCAFMLPIATPPNAIVFGSGFIRMQQMVRYGVLLNLIGVVLVTIVTLTLLIPQFGIDSEAGLPAWAKSVAKENEAG